MVLKISVLFSILFSILLFMFGCQNTISDEWHLAPANGGVGTWTGDTIIALDTYAVELITGMPGVSVSSDGKRDYTLTISVNDSVKVREGGKWYIEENDSSVLKFTPEYNTLNNLYNRSGYLASDSTMHWSYTPSSTKLIRIPIRLQ